MSIKYAAQKVGDAHYVLPKMGGMKVEAHAFLSEELYLNSEESMWDQLKQSASFEGVISAHVMPDCHTGYVLPVGSVVVTDNTILQASSGFDISCGVLYMRVPGVTAEDIKDREVRERWMVQVEDRVATGRGVAAKSQRRTARQVDEILRFGAKALHVPADLCERQYIEVSDEFDAKTVEAAFAKVVPQLGSVGGGNHFIEMQCDRDTGEVYVMIHCGSRGFGWQVADHFYKTRAKELGLPNGRKEESWLYRDSSLGKSYWAHHNAAANYAIANRHIIVEGIREATQQVLKADVEVFYEISHNVVQEETVTRPDGTSFRGLVHRKGATRAFPAGHPDLVGTKWETTGHPCLIPGSMFDGAAVLYAEPGANQSSYTVNHGSGRVLARGQAKRQLESKQEEINAEMRDVKRTFGGVEVTGIVTNHKNVPLDECAHVYKGLDPVLDVLSMNGIARVAHRLYPVVNLKGAD